MDGLRVEVACLFYIVKKKKNPIFLLCLVPHVLSYPWSENRQLPNDIKVGPFWWSNMTEWGLDKSS